MPAPIREAILAPDTIRIRVEAEPAVNALQSLMMLTSVDRHPGLSDWVIQTVSSVSPSVLKRNTLVLYGLHYALTPDRSWETFPAYVDYLESSDPVALRDKVIHAYLNLPCQADKEQPSMEEILESEDGFLDFLRCRFDEEIIIEEVEREAYGLLTHPDEMHAVIVSHLRMMWEEVLKDEWGRVQPLIEESVAAFERTNLEGMTDEEAVQFVTGQKNEKWGKWVEGKGSVIFVPSAHMGPYTGVVHSEDTVWVIFGARQPEGEWQGITDLSRVELLVWLSALSDDTRLRILGLIRERGELCAQEIIDLLELSQSTSSRHLRQLTASGYLRERRIEAGKCYSLNPDRLLDTARAIKSYAMQSSQ
jgi:DNA-binding transcriptional ArsR family regulator